MIRRGEIWWYESPDTSRRPHLVLTRTEGIAVMTQVLTVPATRTIRGISSEVRLGPADGMPAECALSFDNTTVVRRSLLVERITTLTDERMAEVCAAMAFAAACD